MEDRTNGQIYAENRRKMWVLFLWMVLGIVSCITTIAALQTVQTSINIEDSKGAIALTSGYVTSVIFGIFCCPLLLKFAGANGSLVISDLSILLYSLSNLSQDLPILVAGAVISGVGRAVFLPAYTILVLEVATNTAKYSDERDERFYVDYYQSRFYAMMESVSIIGNLLSYAVLYGYAAGGSSEQSNTTPLAPPENSSIVDGDPYEFCGVNDCQDPTVVDENLDQYQPPDRTSVYILVFVTLLLNVFALFGHAFVYPGLGRYSHKLKEIDNKYREKIGTEKHDRGGKRIDAEIFNQGETNGGFETAKEVFDSKDQIDYVDQSRKPAISADKNGTGNLSEFLRTLKETGLFLIKPRAMMLSVSSLHHGMMLGFIFADITRAYVSCTAGVELTGLFAVMFGVLAMPSALLYGKLHFSHKRYIMYAASCALELAIYFLCYFWIPNAEDQWVLLLMFAGFGMVNGIFRQNIIAAYNLHFPENRAIALSMFQVFFTGGIGVQYGLATVMCVREKIFTQVGVLLAGSILFALAEVIRHRKLARQRTKASLEMKTRL